MTRIIEAARGITLDDLLGAAALVALAFYGWPLVAILSELVR